MTTQLHYHQFGEENKNSLLILHGLFGSSRNWQSIAKKLSGIYHVVTIDLRNHGQSFHSDEMTYESMASDVASLILDLEISMPVLIGHSMGGKAAMTLALNKLIELKQLIILDIAPKTYSHDFDVVLNAMVTLPIAGINSRKQADEHLAKTINNPELRAFLLHNLKTKNQSYEWQINLPTLKENIDNIIGFPINFVETKCFLKAFFLAGKNSDYVQEEDHNTIESYFPNAKIEYLDDAGHWLHAEKPMEVIKAIQNFIENT